MMLEMDIHMQKCDFWSIPFTKSSIRSKWMIDLNLKLPKGNIENFYDLGLDRDVLDSKAWFMKEQIY